MEPNVHRLRQCRVFFFISVQLMKLTLTWAVKMCSCNVLGNNKKRVQSWGLFQWVNGSTSLQAFLDICFGWTCSNSGLANCLWLSSQHGTRSSLWFFLREQWERSEQHRGCHTCRSHPLFFIHMHTLVVSANALNEGPRAHSSQEPPISAPLAKDVQFKCLNTASQVMKPVLDRDGWLEHDLRQYSWSIFLVLTKPCKIIASYLCSFFLKWNAQWWCQWLIITFCDWEYRFHCKINANVNCSIFM